MNKLGTAIEIDVLQSGAENLALIIRELTVDDLVWWQKLATDSSDPMQTLSSRIIGHLPVAIFGEHFYGGDKPGCYPNNIDGTGAGIIGRFGKIGLICLGEPVLLYENPTLATGVVPALTFETLDIVPDDIELGSAQLYPHVAVPLVGQPLALFSLV